MTAERATVAAEPADVAVGSAAPAVPRWAAALAIFAASRIWSTLLFAWVGTQDTVQSRAGVRPSLLQLAIQWDGQWYWWVAVHGYPSVLQYSADGAVQANPWAFLPAYPLLVKALALGSTAAWPPVAVAVSLVFGFGCAVLLAVLLTPHVGRSRALWAVGLFSVSPLAFLLQTAYAESMGLFLLLAALCLADRHRYLAAVPVTVLFAFTRPGALALALAVGLHLVVRAVAARRGRDRLTAGQAVRGALLAAAAVGSGLAWPVIAGVVTGVPDAYIRTEAAWRSIWLGDAHVTYFSGWLEAGRFWSGRWFPSLPAPVVGVVLVAAVVGGAVALLSSPAVRRLGALLRLWCASYALYLLAVFFPQSSVFRILMPMAPLAGALIPASRIARIALLVVAGLLQAVWIWVVLGPVQAYWTVP